MTPLVPCPACGRHVRISERACPFCASALEDAHLGEARVPAPGAPRSRAALFGLAAGATIAAATLIAESGCGSTAQALYGLPFPDDAAAPTDAGDAGDAGDGAAPDEGGVQPHYGLPGDASFD